MPKKSKGQRKSSPIARRRSPRTGRRGRMPQTKVWNQLSMRSPAWSTAMSIDNQVFRVKQIADLTGILTSSVSVYTSNGLSFNIGQLPQVATWVAAFDQYRIDAIEAWITPIVQSSVASPDGFHWYNVIDYDDDGTTATETQLQQYPNVTDLNRTEGCYRMWQPHVAVGQNSGGSTSLSKNVPADWIDSGATSVKHFGLKVGMIATAISTQLYLKLRFHISFRNVF